MGKSKKTFILSHASTIAVNAVTTTMGRNHWISLQSPAMAGMMAADDNGIRRAGKIVILHVLSTHVQHSGKINLIRWPRMTAKTRKIEARTWFYFYFRTNERLQITIIRDLTLSQRAKVLAWLFPKLIQDDKRKSFFLALHTSA